MLARQAYASEPRFRRIEGRSDGIEFSLIPVQKGREKACPITPEKGFIFYEAKISARP
jgi:hypothetical protein